jgi:DNA-binding Xre family transcriptional regulator
MAILKFTCNLDVLLTANIPPLTPTQMSSNSGISMNTIYKLTGGGRLERIDRSTTEKIMTYFNCKFEDVWTIIFEDASVDN